jgi:LysM repeat protein
MKQFYAVIFFAFVLSSVNAQNLVVQQDAGKLYLGHAVAAKENWYSIGRMFNLSPGVIASYNGMSLDKGLSIGQKLKVPLNAQNLAQSGQPASDEAFIPVYHTVKEKEGLFRIGQSYNKVPAEQLKSWNKLKSDDLVIGSNLIVGYLRVKKDQSPLAGGGVAVPTTQTAGTTAVPGNTETQKSTTAQNNKPAESAATNVSKTNTPTSTSSTSTPLPNAPGTEGAFAAVFKEQSKGSSQVTGVAGIFKSTSGWKDGKYYVLMNKVTPGTIVKITSVSNSKSVYAKVLGEIPPGKENEGLLIRLSNAAGAQLQIPDNSRFDVQLIY